MTATTFDRRGGVCNQTAVAILLNNVHYRVECNSVFLTDGLDIPHFASLFQLELNVPVRAESPSLNVLFYLGQDFFAVVYHVLTRPRLATRSTQHIKERIVEVLIRHDFLNYVPVAFHLSKLSMYVNYLFGCLFW